MEKNFKKIEVVLSLANNETLAYHCKPDNLDRLPALLDALKIIIANDTTGQVKNKEFNNSK